MYQKKKNTIKAIALVLVLVLLTIGVAFAIVKVTGVDKTKTIGSTAFDWQLGGLDGDGDLDEELNAISTKRHISVDGLKIEVVKKPGVEVYVALFDKKGNPLNVTTTEGVATYDAIETSTTEATEWTYDEYIADANNSTVAEGKPAYAVVILVPTSETVELTALNMRDYAKQVTISCNR